MPGGEGVRRLGAPAALAGLIGSYAALTVGFAVMAWEFAGIDADWISGVIVLLIGYASPIWLVGMLAVGLPVTTWIERRTPPGASFARRYGPYAVAGAGVAVLLSVVLSLLAAEPPLIRLLAPFPLVCALGTRAGIGAWRRWAARNGRDADPRTGW